MLFLQVFLFLVRVIVMIHLCVFVVVVTLFLLVVLISLSQTCLRILYEMFRNPIWFHFEEWNTTSELVLVVYVILKLLFLLFIDDVLVCLLVLCRY